MIPTHPERPTGSERLMTTRSRTLPTITTIAAFALGAVALAAAVAIAMQPRPMTGTTPVGLSDLGRRVLVIAAHPDDEVLTAGGSIAELVADGARVRVVIVSAGDGYRRAASRMGSGTPGVSQYRLLGDVRHRESLSAAARLGLEPADVISLGYADGGIAAMWDDRWDPTRPYVGRSGEPTVTYPWAYRAEAVQCGHDLAADLTDVVKRFTPDTVISPDTRETHPDHSGVAAFTMLALDRAGFSGTRLTAIVHFKRYPYPWAYMPQAGLAPPPQLLEPDADWLALPLSAASEQIKKAAFEEYKSQTAILDLSWYMRAFVRRNELFCRRASTAPAAAPTDSRPGSGDSGTVAVTPPPVIASSGPNAARITALRMVRGPQVLWLGAVCEGPPVAGAEYRVSLRLMKDDATLRRLDVRVLDGRAEALSLSDDSVEPTGVTAVVDGSTVWVSVPARVLEGCGSAIAGAWISVSGRRDARTPWVDVRL
jgi:LmbE family N-acetylglucosaminyl deacetylase